MKFKKLDNVSKILQVHYHHLGGEKIDPKACSQRSMQKIRKHPGKCTIFLGGHHFNVTEETIPFRYRTIRMTGYGVKKISSPTKINQQKDFNYRSARRTSKK